MNYYYCCCCCFCMIKIGFLHKNLVFLVCVVNNCELKRRGRRISKSREKSCNFYHLSQGHKKREFLERQREGHEWQI